MKVIITATEPSRFEQELMAKVRIKEVDVKTKNVIIGRGQVEQQQDTQIIKIGNKSISRKHVKISLPFYLINKNASILGSTMEMKQDILVPKYYSRLGGLWQHVPPDVLTRIRRYCMPKPNIIVTDLDSTFGLYQLAKIIRISDSILPVTTRQTPNNNKEYPHGIKLEDMGNIVVQLGSLDMRVEQIRRRLSMQDMKLYHEKLTQKYGNLKRVTNIRRQSQENVYWSILIKQVHDRQDAQCHLITVIRQEGEQSQKISVGRNSLCHVKINRSEVSRKQAFIYVDVAGHWVIQDNKSTNGTWLKRNKIIYDIEGLKPKQEQNSTLAVSHGNDDSSIIYATDKLIPINIKLGQIRLDIQIQGTTLAYQHIREKISKHSNNINDYTSILAQISVQKQQNSQQIADHPVDSQNHAQADLNQSFYGDLCPHDKQNSNPNQTIQILKLIHQ